MLTIARMMDGDEGSPPDDPEEKEDRAAILARRRFFIATAVLGLVTTSCAVSVDPTPHDATVQQDAGPQPCLRIALDAGPQPCLDTIPVDDVVETLDAGSPQPCLSFAPPDR